jgi:1-phosphofructokinase
MSPADQSAPFATVITVTFNTAVDCIFHVPGFAIGAHARGTRVARQPAGKGVNVARALAALGHGCIATGFVGEVSLAEFDGLSDSPLLKSQFLAVEGETRENITLVDPDEQIETHVRTDGYTVTERDWERLVRKLMLLAKPEALFVLAGSLPAGVAPQAVRDLVTQLSAQGSAVALDLAPQALAVLLDQPWWLLKCNRAEFVEACGDVEDCEAAIIDRARALAPAGRGAVVVTFGEAGSYGFWQGGGWLGQVDGVGDRVISTVGCGDALLAGYIAGWQRDGARAGAFQLALAAATAAAGNLLPGEITPQQIETYTGQVDIVELGKPEPRP